MCQWQSGSVFSFPQPPCRPFKEIPVFTSESTLLARCTQSEDFDLKRPEPCQRRALSARAWETHLNHPQRHPQSGSCYVLLCLKTPKKNWIRLVVLFSLKKKKNPAHFRKKKEKKDVQQFGLCVFFPLVSTGQVLKKSRSAGCSGWLVVCDRAGVGSDEAERWARPGPASSHQVRPYSKVEQDMVP